MVCNDEKKLECQQQILEALNEFLVVSPLLFDVSEKICFQKSVQNKYIKNLVFNGLSSFFCSVFSFDLAEYLLNTDIASFREYVTVAVASCLGFLLLQRDNVRYFYENSLDLDELDAEFDDIGERFLDVIIRLDTSIKNYIYMSRDRVDTNLDDVEITGMIQDIFVSNKNYLVSKIFDNSFKDDFGYDTVNETFNSVFDLDDGITEYISKFIVSNDKKRVRKR